MACPASLVFPLSSDGPLDRLKRDFFAVRISIARFLDWPRRAYAFLPEYIQAKTRTPFLGNCVIVEVRPLFMCFKGDSNLPGETCLLRFCLGFNSSSLPYLNIFFDESCPF